jgi:hypothetical protein
MTGKPKRATDVEIPAPIAIGLMTGRPELAKFGMTDLGKTGSREDLQAAAASMSEYAEAMIAELQQERKNLTAMTKAVDDAVSNMRGALRFVERVQRALSDMSKGTAPDVIAERLRNPLRDEEGE